MSSTLTTYTICIREPLETYWQEWFDNIQFSTAQDGTTLLTGTHLDQVALHGILTKIHNLGLTLVSVNQLENAADSNNPT